MRGKGKERERNAARRHVRVNDDAPDKSEERPSLIIDSHTHMPTPEHCGGHDFIKEVSAAVAYLRAAGTDAAIFNTWRAVLGTTADDLAAGNETALAMAREFDGFLYPGATLDPLFPGASLDWLARFRDLGLLWVGELLPKKDCAYDDPRYMRLFEACARGGHIVQLHNHDSIAAVACRFPRMPVVCAHVPGAGQCRALAALPNVWMDVSGQHAGLSLGGMELARATMGAGRLLYGTDFSGYEPRCFMARTDQVFPEAAERERIYNGNVRRLLALAGSRPIGC